MIFATASIPGQAPRCFHCGLPNPEKNPVPSLTVLGSEREFCCHGCRTVCQTIIDSGLEDYYQHRTESAPTQSIEESADFLALYDRPDIKNSFVIDHAGLEEACLMLEDIHCSACVWLNEHHLRQLDGIVSAHIDAVTHRAVVRWQPEKLSLSEILGAIRHIGYHAHPYDPAKNEKQLAERKLKSTERLLFSGLFGMFIMHFSIATYFMGGSVVAGDHPPWEVGGRWISLLLSLALLAYPAQTFFVSAWRALRRGHVNMDVPIVIGLSAAFSGSFYATVTMQGEVYYEAIAMFVFFVLLSRRWELKGQLYASHFLSRLNKQKLKTAEKISASGETETVSVNDLEPGDRVAVLPGETVPIDGELIGKKAEFDESLLTGESLPQIRYQGDHISAGSINGEQRILLFVEHEAGFSTIEEINRLVLRGIENKPKEEILINRVASYFITALLIVTALTFGFWFLQGDPGWLSKTIAVLIVTCPCALALAIPVANSIASGRLLEMGLLPINLNAMPALAKAKTFVFDKTGTLTDSKLRLIDSWFQSEDQEAQIIDDTQKLASQSEHPIARAIVARYGSGKSAPVDVINTPGSGLESNIAGSQYRLGALDFVFSQQNLPGAFSDVLQKWHASGYQVTALSKDGNLIAAFACSNPLRPGVKQLFSELGNSGVDDMLIVSGDHEANVAQLAKSVGVDRYVFRQTPAEKLKLVSELRRDDNLVVMVGDGINDAPTLAAADASISFVSATDLAKIHSDFVLLSNQVSRITTARKLAIKTRRIIHQNLFWAVSYNIILVPAAASGYVQPWLAAIGMSVSSLLVVSNSLRLRQKKADPSLNQHETSYSAVNCET